MYTALLHEIHEPSFIHKRLTKGLSAVYECGI